METNTFMQKSFLIKSRNFKEISGGKGSLEFLLVDENGDNRTVVATAKLGRFKEFKTIKAIYKREILLVKALTKASVNDTIHIDFTKFNAKHARKPSNTGGKNKTRQEVTPNYGSFSDLEYLLSDKLRLFQLLGIAGIGFVGFLLFKGSI